jgi:hypothetical protein
MKPAMTETESGPSRIRVLIASNSQGTGAGVPMGSNYPAIVRDALGDACDVHWLLMSGWTLRDLDTHLDENVIAIEPRIVIIQFGIVECTRRILSETEKRIVSRLPFGRKVTRAMHASRARVLMARRRLRVETRVMD